MFPRRQRSRYLSAPFDNAERLSKVVADCSTGGNTSAAKGCTRGSWHPYAVPPARTTLKLNLPAPRGWGQFQDGCKKFVEAHSALERPEDAGSSSVGLF
jgi:hypothetical protein